jgi:hypothetical protein
MKPLILAGEYGIAFFRSDLADITVPFSFRFASSSLPALDELNTYVARRSDRHGPGSHWSDYAGRWRKADADRKDVGLFEFCESYKTVELWFDKRPNDQLQLIWMLDLLRSAPEIAGRLKLRFLDYDLLGTSPEELSRWEVPFIDPTNNEFETASLVWQAYRAASPATFVRLLSSDLSALPLLRPALLHLVEELPSVTTGLGATEMRLLELIARGYERTNALFHLRSLSQRRIFNEWELGLLLCGLAHGPTPAIAGLDDELRKLGKEQYRSRQAAYLRSRLSLTDFGRAVVAHKEDFSRHNPIDRWWGGTHLTNDSLWRWNPALVAP